jgi:hypothetical protein
MALLFISLIVVSIVTCVKTVKKSKENAEAGRHKYDGGFSGGMIFLMGASLVTFVPSFFLLIHHIKSFLFVTLAPKVWLLEYAAQLIKSN